MRAVSQGQDSPKRRRLCLHRAQPRRQMHTGLHGAQICQKRQDKRGTAPAPETEAALAPGATALLGAAGCHQVDHSPAENKWQVHLGRKRSQWRRSGTWQCGSAGPLRARLAHCSARGCWLVIPQDDVGCVDSCLANGHKLCLHNSKLCVETGWVCPEPDYGC